MSRAETAEALRNLADHLEARAEQHAGGYCDGMYDSALEARALADEIDPHPHPPRCVHGRYSTDPCTSCGRRYVDGTLTGPFHPLARS